jgi:hypothetical protein
MKALTKFLGRLALLAPLVLAAVDPAAAQVQTQQNVIEPLFKNLLANGRLDIYPVGTTNVFTSSTVSATLTGLNTTPTYLAARWATWANAAGASVTVANSTTTGVPAGFQNAVSITRASGNTNTTQICHGQELRSADVIQLQGQTLGFSVWATAGANFSAASSNVTLQAFTGTATDQGLTTMLSGWTGPQTPLTSNQAITTTPTRLGATFTVPLTATEMTVATCWTPVGTAGAADTLFVTGLQLEQGGNVTSFKALPLSVELNSNVLPYTYAFQDGAATRHFPCFGQVATGTTTAIYTCNTPVQMRAVPTVTVQTAASFASAVAAGTAANCTTLAATATSATVNSISLTCTTSGLTTASGVPLLGQATTGWVLASADFWRRSERDPHRKGGFRPVRPANVNRRRHSRAA